MEIRVQSQKFGQGAWSSKNLLLPDHVASYFEKYSLDIVEYPVQQCMSLFFRNKNDQKKDVWSHTIHRPSIQANIIHGFKTVFEELAVLDTKQLDIKEVSLEMNEGLGI